MARVRDLWHDKNRRKTARHPDNGGNKDAKRWLALWIGPDSEEHSKAFAKQSDAQKYATAMEADALRGIRYADPRRGAITVRSTGKAFLPSMLHLRPNSADTYASHLGTTSTPRSATGRSARSPGPTCSLSCPGLVRRWLPRPRRRSTRCCGR